MRYCSGLSRSSDAEFVLQFVDDLSEIFLQIAPGSYFHQIRGRHIRQTTRSGINSLIQTEAIESPAPDIDLSELPLLAVAERLGLPLVETFVKLSLSRVLGPLVDELPRLGVR